MKLAIVGAGEVGCSIARRLSGEGHDVYLVEQDDSRAELAEEALDVTVIRGNGARPKVMDEVFRVAGSLDLLVACTNRDEANMIACWIARKRGVKRVIARARNLEFTDSATWARELGIDQLISPERSVAREITGLLASRSTHTEDLLDGRAALYVFRVMPGSHCDGHSLEEIRQSEICRNSTTGEQLKFVVVYLERKHVGSEENSAADGEENNTTEVRAEVTIDEREYRTNSALVPDGKAVLHAGDLCYVVMLKRDVERLETLFTRDSSQDTSSGKSKNKKNSSHLKRVFIVGGGKVGYQVARQIRREYGNLGIRMIDSDRAQCAKLAQDFGELLVLNADGADRDLLLREGIDTAAGYVAATGNDELNLIYAAMAKSFGARRAIAVVRQSRYQDLPSAGLPVDAIVNTNEALASVILGEVRYPGTARTLSIIEDIDAEMLELILPEGFESRKLMDLGLPRGELVALQARNDDVQVPGGMTVLSPGDRIILFASSEKMQHALKFFQPESDTTAETVTEDLGVFGS